MKESLAYNKAFKFAIRIVNLYKHLCKEKNEYIISKQISQLKMLVRHKVLTINKKECARKCT
ncbi:hypothetical protein HGG79_20145 [Clostridium tetanomorphum]|uniref:Uncharacterized protein n=1 Tax=Clostridium tetanomorphum TaxID=1553 RepID=A0A923J299_CLOTT|nr:hypothetical protein [Clostridium tetanomorphum]